eukprot:15089504-Alexandrium_andersonii.AAC.1
MVNVEDGNDLTPLGRGRATRPSADTRGDISNELLPPGIVCSKGACSAEAQHPAGCPQHCVPRWSSASAPCKWA